MTYLGDFFPGCTIRHAFTTRNFSTGAPFTLAGTPALLVRRNVGAQDHSCVGLSLVVDCMGRTGMNTWEIRTSSDQSFYSCGADFTVEVAVGTVNSVSVVGEIVATYSLTNRSHVMPIAPGCGRMQLDVTGRVMTQPCSTVFSVQSVINTVTPNPCSSIFSVHSLDNSVIGVSGNVTGSVGSVTGAVGSVTGNVGNVVAMSAGAIGSGDIASAALNEIADAFLDRVMSAGTDSGTDNTTGRTVRQALRTLRNKVDANAGRVYKEDDTTISHTFTISSAVCNPINVVDPT